MILILSETERQAKLFAEIDSLNSQISEKKKILDEDLPQLSLFPT